ncbi:PREDICTED: uncharacterized protein LOC105459532 isoform X2 [Wasmannia auropunctata]|uniref:uncharacterized protein LOC105459532 isoform X2 n=1 Tax=Wasmannia auropunctata TaxID=64793 RepID=UPI0005EFF5EF|nr:PREDICTED: uncharacterized protein LOC105459532 isoform X2 [Wasmannia auropunctata]
MGCSSYPSMPSRLFYLLLRKNSPPLKLTLTDHVTARCCYPRHRQKFNNVGWNFKTSKYKVFLEPPAAFTSHVSHGVIVFLGDQRATSRHSWNISVVSPIKYSSSLHV